MTRSVHSSSSTDRDELKQRYADHGQVEPAAGLDRLIRARAEQAVADRSPRRPARWVGGLATAMALVLAIGVVVRQQPPQPESLSVPSDIASDRQAEPAAALGEGASSEPRRSPAPAARREAGNLINQRAGLDASEESARRDLPAPEARLIAPAAELAPDFPPPETLADDTIVEPEEKLRQRQAIRTAIELGQFERAAELLDALHGHDDEAIEALQARLEAARAGARRGDD